MNIKQQHSVAVIGAGPAGLFAAQTLAQAGCHVEVFDQKPTPARKFLMAGRGGLNITHSEDYQTFITRYGAAQNNLKPALDGFTPDDMRAWCQNLEEETFIGSSGRVFPKSMKASPLLRKWLSALDELGVVFHMRHRWDGWNEDGHLVFTSGESQKTQACDAVLLCLGGASWPSLGSDGAWQNFLARKNIDVKNFEPSNCGFEINWSDYIRTKFAGQPLKAISLSIGNTKVMGEMMITDKGIEGGAVYALSSTIRRAINQNNIAHLLIDLRPNMSVDDIQVKLSLPRARHSFSTWLQKSLKLSPLAIALLREGNKDISSTPIQDLARLIKSVRLTALAPFPIDRAISSAGGISLSEIDENYMLKNLSGVFAAGEMLDWEAPTGGYLLQGCFATGKAAAKGILHWLQP